MPRSVPDEAGPKAGVDSLPSESVLGGLPVDSSFIASRPPARRLVSPLENASISRLLAPTQASLARSKSAATLSAVEGRDPAGNSPEPSSRAASLARNQMGSAGLPCLVECFATSGSGTKGRESVLTINPPPCPPRYINHPELPLLAGQRPQQEF